MLTICRFIYNHFFYHCQSEGLWRILTAYEDKSATAVCTLAFCTGKEAKLPVFETTVFASCVCQVVISMFSLCSFYPGVTPHADPVLFTGTVDGTIVEPIEGTGFGWDSIFVPNGEDQPFSCLSTERKNELSHRGSAVRQWAKVRGSWKNDVSTRLNLCIMVLH